MHGTLLIGIVAFGVGWAWVFRDKNAKPAENTVQAATPVTVPESTPTTDVEKTGLEAVKDAIDCESHAASIGGDIAGSDGGQTIPVKMMPPEGNNVAVDREASTGGADPATQRTKTNAPDDAPPALWAGDSFETIMVQMYGTSDGLTPSQIAEAYKASSAWSGVVY